MYFSTQLFPKSRATLPSICLVLIVLLSCANCAPAAERDSVQVRRWLDKPLRTVQNALENVKTRDSSPTVENDERSLSPDGQPGTYARLTRLSDGSLLSSYTHFDGPTHVLTVAKSTDNANTFTPWGEVMRGDNDIDNLFLIEVSEGTILGAFRNHGAGGNPNNFLITVCKSTDGGKTWKYLNEAARQTGPLGIYEPFMRIGKKGQVQMVFSQEFATNDQRTMLVESTNKGSSWSSPKEVAAGNMTRDGMTGIAATSDNGRDALVLVFETNPSSTFEVECMISYDDGASWGKRQGLYVPPHGRNAGSPQIASFADGSLAAVFMTDLGLPTQQWPTTAAVRVSFAKPPNNGRLEWSAPQLVSPSISSWPGVMTFDDHTLMTSYEHGGAPQGRTLKF